MSSAANPIRAYRLACGLSVAQFAHMAGVTIGTVRRVETATRNLPHALTMVRMVRAMAPHDQEQQRQTASDWLAWWENAQRLNELGSVSRPVTDRQGPACPAGVG